jgi:hypothetical protein
MEKLDISEYTMLSINALYLFRKAGIIARVVTLPKIKGQLTTYIIYDECR